MLLHCRCVIVTYYMMLLVIVDSYFFVGLRLLTLNCLRFIHVMFAHVDVACIVGY
eukprot:gene2657-1655_t